MFVKFFDVGSLATFKKTIVTELRQLNRAGRQRHTIQKQRALELSIENIDKGLLSLKNGQNLVRVEILGDRGLKDAKCEKKNSREKKLEQRLDNESSLQFCITRDDTCAICITGTVKRDIKTSLLICETCGNAEQYMDCSYTNVGFNDMDIEFQNFSYRRINHFCEWLNATQAKESNSVDERVLEMVMSELIRMGKLDADQISLKDIRQALKHLKLQKFYENTPSIHSLLTGIPPPRFTQYQEKLLKTMFHQIQKPFAAVCPPNRKNFLSYSFCLYKFSELLDLKYSHLFKLLKGKDKLARQDEIWKGICQQLGWKFYPTTIAV